MFELTAVQIALLILMIYVCVYGIVNRICKCIEHCATGKAYQTAMNNANAVSEEKK